MAARGAATTPTEQFDEIVVFSPHCDDVPLSLGGAILGKTLSTRVTVEVVFSLSRYSLSHSVTEDVAKVTETRHSEELAAAKMAGYKVHFMGFPEPFVRHGYRTFREVFDGSRPVRYDPIWPSVRAALRFRVSTTHGLVLCPLRCGHHIDHRIVFESVVAFCRTMPRPLIGFYEDLPYAAWLRDSEISSLVPDLPSGPLQPITIANIPFGAKAALLDSYPSQLTAQDIESVFAHWTRRGGERLWLSPAVIHAFFSQTRPSKPLSV